MPKANMTVYIERTITDTKTGKVIKRYRKRQAKSFVKAFMQHLEAIMGHIDDTDGDLVTVKDVTNADKGIKAGTTASKVWFSIEAPANLATYGIQIGIGTTAPTVSDYTVETQIAHGVGAGQMSHGATSVQTATVSGSDMEMPITRVFVNSSGGSITVKEVTLVCKSFAQYVFLLMRDAVDDPVANGQTYTVTYTFTTTV